MREASRQAGFASAGEPTAVWRAAELWAAPAPQSPTRSVPQCSAQVFDGFERVIACLLLMAG